MVVLEGVRAGAWRALDLSTHGSVDVIQRSPLTFIL